MVADTPALGTSPWCRLCGPDLWAVCPQPFPVVWWVIVPTTPPSGVPSLQLRHRWTIPAVQLTSKKAFICFWTLFTNLHWMTKLREKTEQCLSTSVITALTSSFTASIEAHQRRETPTSAKEIGAPGLWHALFIH